MPILDLNKIAYVLCLSVLGFLCIWRFLKTPPLETKVFKVFSKVGPFVANDGSSTMVCPHLECMIIATRNNSQRILIYQFHPDTHIPNICIYANLNSTKVNLTPFATGNFSINIRIIHPEWFSKRIILI